MPEGYEDIDLYRRPPFVYQRPKTNIPSLGCTKKEIQEYELKNNHKIAQELDKIREMLDLKKPQILSVNRKKQKQKNPVSKLSEALKQYKTERIQTENDLIKRIKKVNLDKSILFREKQNTLWRDLKDQS